MDAGRGSGGAARAALIPRPNHALLARDPRPVARPAGSLDMGGRGGEHAPVASTPPLDGRPRPWRGILAAVLGLIALAAPAAAAPGDHLQIRGGAPVAQGALPWPAHLTISSDGDPVGFCSGTVIGPRWVLSAAHCVTETDDDGSRPLRGLSVSVITGTADLRQVGPSGGQVQVANRVIVHPGFDLRSSFADDLTLLRLPAPVPVAGLPLLAGGDGGSALAGAGAVAAGFGVLERADGELPDVLHSAGVTILADAECDRQEPFDLFFPASMICTGAVPPAPDATGTCKGDSGGPLALRGGDGVWRQVGITSWSPVLDCSAGPDVYARVSAYVPWIASQLAADPAAPVGAPAIERAVAAPGGAGEVSVALRVDPRGLAGAYRIDHGPTATLGASVAGMIAGTGPVDVAVPLAGLPAGAPYNVRISAATAAGAAVGAIQPVTVGGTLAVPAAAGAAAPRCRGAVATIVGTPGDDVLRGTPGDDVIVALSGDDRVVGGSGDDLICGDSGADRASAGPGADRVFGDTGADVLAGGTGRDILAGGPGRDRLIGGPGRDRAAGGPSRDVCQAERRLGCEVALPAPS